MVVMFTQQCECTHATELYILKIKQKTGSAGEDMEKSAYSWWGYKMVQLLWTTVWWSLKN